MDLLFDAGMISRRSPGFLAIAGTSVLGLDGRAAPMGKQRALTRWVITALLAGCLGLVVVQPCSAAVLKSVQSNTAVLGTGSTSNVVPISAVDLTKSFLVFSLRHGIADPIGSQVTGQITSPTSITFQRVGTTGAVTIEWSVVEFAAGVTVQRGSRLIDTATKNVTLSNVALGRSFPIVSLRVGGTQWSDEDFVRARLTSTTNLELSMYVGRIDAVAEWQVVEYTDAVVQTGDVSFAVGDSSKTVSGLTNFDSSRAWLLYSYMNDTGTTNIAQKLVRGLITGPTSLQFDRDSTGQSVDLTWHLVEFQDTTVVQHANAGFSSAETSKDVTINVVDMARSIAVGGYGTRGGKTNLTSTDRTGPGWFTADLTSSTTLRLSRGETQSVTADLGWFVIEFRPPLEMVKRAFQSDGTPIANGATLPRGTAVKFLIYVDNFGAALADVSLQDVLDPAFLYQASSMKVDGTLQSSVVCPAGICDEAAIFSQVDGSGTPVSDGDLDGDVASYTALPLPTIDLGDGVKPSNTQLDVAADRVWAVVFTISMQ